MNGRSLPASVRGKLGWMGDIELKIGAELCGHDLVYARRLGRP